MATVAEAPAKEKEAASSVEKPHEIPEDFKPNILALACHYCAFAAADLAGFSLETVGCLGSCAQAPLMMIDDKYFGRMAVDKVPKILKPYKQ